MKRRGRALGALLLLTTAPALGAPEGPTFTVFERPTVTRFPDVAYDSEAGAFLVVSGQAGITARFVAASGPQGDAFDVTTEATAYSPRVAAVGGAFLACWHVEASFGVVCRSVQPGGALGTEHVLESGGSAKHLESAPSLACSKSAGECLVTWADSEESLNLRGRRVALDGSPLSASLDLAVTPAVFEAFPAVALSEVRGEYLVAHTREPGSLAMAIAGVRVAVGGAAIASSELYALAGFNNYPEIAADPDGDRYLAVSWINGGNPDVGGQLVAGDGTPLGTQLAVAASSGFEGGDGIGLAFDRAAATYLAVFQGPETPGEAQQVWGCPVRADGTVESSFQVTTSAVQNGVYQPRAASDGLGRLLVVTVADYERIDGQWVRFETPDAGASGGSGGSAGSGWSDSGSAGASGSGGSSGSAALAGDDEGCGCRTAGAASPLGWLALLALTGALRARRANARRPRCW